MNLKTIATSSAALALLFTGGCETLNKEQMGTGIGATIGGIIGNQAADENKEVWTVVGAIAGGFIGNRIGKYLDEQDQARMAQATQTAVKTGQTSVWSNPENNTSGSARVLKTTTTQKTVQVPVLKSKVSKVPPLDIVGETYKAKKTANLRGGPGTDYVVVGDLTAGETFMAIGKVKGEEWFLTSQEGVGNGFVYAPLVEAAPNITLNNSGSGVDAADIQQASITTDVQCREVEQSVKLANGQTHSETLEACQGANGWEVKQA